MIPNNFLSQQQKLTNQINQLMAQSSQALLCGPGTECERTKTTEDLQQKYLAAQTTVQSASYQEKAAEKNYYVYTKGDAAYNDMQRQNLLTDADNKANEILVSFNKDVARATEMNDTLSNLTKNSAHVTELYNNYLQENAILKEEIKLYASDMVTSDRKTYYETQNYDILKTWYIIWRWIYFLLVVTFAIGIFLTKSSYSLRTKIILLVLLFIYPYVIDYVVLYLLKWLMQIYSLLPKNVYTSL